MKAAPVVDAKGQQLLELLADGASTMVLSRKLGYSPGTVRVYLHNLYRAIGVRNRTEAVLWHLNRVRPAEKRPAAVTPRVALADETFGDVALRDGLLATLGVMESFVGPYGRVWEVGVRLKGGTVAEAAAFRDDARQLWRALLQASFGYGKALRDEGLAERLLGEAPAEATLLVALLALGGYSHAADGCIAQLTRARKGGRALSARESAFLRSLRAAVYEEDAQAIESLQALAADDKAAAPLRHVALVSLFHLHRARKEPLPAREVANVLWSEAEAARQQLEAMGVRPLARESALSRAAKAPTRVPATTREKEAAER